MKGKILVLVLCIGFNLACEDEEAFDAENLLEIITEVRVEDNNQLADGVHKVKVTTVFPDDFNTEDNGKVTYSIFRDELETKESEIVTTVENGEEIRKSELLVTSTKADTLKIRATIIVAEKSVFKETEIQFRRALPDSINIKSSSLSVSPDDFTEIELTTELIRSVGKVSANSFAETIVHDVDSNSRGFFKNYSTFSDKDGNIKNKFTMGNDEYLGTLYAITMTKDEFDIIKADTITLVSIPKE